MSDHLSKDTLERVLGFALASTESSGQALGALVVALVWFDDLFPGEGGIEGIAKLLVETSRRPGRKQRTGLDDFQKWVFETQKIEGSA